MAEIQRRGSDSTQGKAELSTTGESGRMSEDKLKLLGRKEVSSLFSLPLSTLDGLVATRSIPFFRISRRNIRFKEAELLEWLETRRNLPYRTSHDGLESEEE